METENKKTLSIVIPVYNVADYLPDCMQSLLSQNTEGCEIILVDDGSTDEKSGVLCDQYAADYPNLIRCIHQENGGLGAARNTGLENAFGEYLFFLDSDDYVRPGSLDVMQKTISESNADMIVFGFEYVTENGTIPQETRLIKSPGHSLTLHENPVLLLENPSACTRLWKKRLFDGGLRFPSRVWYEDLRTTPKALAEAESIWVSDEVLYCYRLREGSIIRNSNVKRNLEIIDALKDVHAYFKANDPDKFYHPVETFLAVQTILEAARRVLMQDPSADYLPQFINYLGHDYPDYKRYVSARLLGYKKYMFLKLLENQQYAFAKSIFDAKAKIKK